MGNLDFENSIFTITGSWSANENAFLHLALLDVESLLDTDPNNDIPDGFLGTADLLVDIGVIDQSDILFRIDRFGPISELINEPVSVAISGTESDLNTRLVLLDYSASISIPEPSTLALLSSSLIGLMVINRRQSKRDKKICPEWHLTRPA